MSTPNNEQSSNKKYSFKEKSLHQLWLIRNWLFEQYIKFEKKEHSTHTTLCVIPWLSLNIVPSGWVHHCCMTSDYQAFIGDLTKQTLEEVWNGDPIRTIRKTMIKGEEPILCSRCFESERSSGISARIHQNKSFKSKLKEIRKITKSDGSLDKIDLKYWDFRFSNVCNYKCRVCNAWNSCAWAHDARELGCINDKESEKLFKIDSLSEKIDLDFLKKYIDTVERIYFSGGEPLLMDEHWQILEMLDERKRYDVYLSYNTNLSILKYKNKNVFDYWVKWGDRIWLWPSIDEIGERAELIRSGTNWKNVEANLKAIIEHGIFVQPNITISAMNVFRIPEIIDGLIEVGVIRQKGGNWRNFNINIVTDPPLFHVSILPDNIRLSVRSKLENYINEYKQRYGVGIRDHFLHLFWHLDKPWQKENGIAFKEFTNTIDKIRGENTLDIIPELSCVL